MAAILLYARLLAEVAIMRMRNAVIVGNSKAAGCSTPAPSRMNVCISRLTLVLIVIVPTASSSIVSAAAAKYMFADIADALRAADAQFTDLYIEATTTWPINPDNPAAPRRALLSTCAFKFPEGWEYECHYDTFLDPKTGIPLKDLPRPRTVAFDGSATVYLSNEHGKKKDRLDYVQAMISPGRVDLFSQIGNPFLDVWRYGNRANTFEALFAMGANRFDHDTVSDRMDGEDTVRIRGTLDSGSIEVRLWVVPEKGFTPIRLKIFTAADGVQFYDKAYSNFTKLANGMWFPQVIYFGGDAAKPETMITTHITKISADKLSQSFFHPTIPPRTHVSDHILKQTYVTAAATTGPTSTTQRAKEVEAALKAYADEAKKQANEQR